ncbi:MAG: cytochrome-c peroxidase [Polyangiales bacterium]
MSDVVCDSAPRLVLSVLTRLTALWLCSALVTACGDDDALTGDPVALRTAMVELGAATPVLPTTLSADDPKLRLGQALFFDKLLSGNRDISCATCHHPVHASADALPLSIGVGGQGLGPTRRQPPERPFIPRHAPEVFNRDAAEWVTMFWDRRVRQEAGQLTTPAGAALPPGLTHVLAVQAMFPVTSHAEMRGAPGDNEIADAPDLPAVWQALMARLVAVPEYVTLFAAAFPQVPTGELSFAHAAEAIAAFEGTAFRAVDTPYDRFLAGDDGALTPEARRGAALFFGAGQCVRCHMGPLLSDQQVHVIGGPQLGPGKEGAAPDDLGGFGVSQQESERWAFRTPPLRNVELTAPYMHAGAYRDLQAVVQHHFDPAAALSAYDVGQLPVPFQSHLLRDPAREAALEVVLDSDLPTGMTPSDSELTDLVAFLQALTDPASHDLTAWLPASVPSGLPVVD